jgi:putative pyrroloquinoline-quinone binding quinoprotein
VTASPTFQCPFCGAPITGNAPGATFACPYCQARVVAPHAGAMVTGPSAGRSSWEPSAPPRDERPFSGGPWSVAIGSDPQLGFLAVGVHAPIGQPPCLRAWDLRAGRVAWEAQRGQPWLEGVSAAAMKIIGRNLYVAHKRQLLCLDLANGTRRWAAGLSDTVVCGREPGQGLSIADPFPLVGRGAILAATSDHGLFAFDRDSGQPLWNRSFGDKAIDVEPVENEGACVVRVRGWTKVEIVNPAYADPIARFGDDHWSTDLGLARLFGRTVATVVDDAGPEGDEDGILCFDAVTGAKHFFDPVEDLEEDDVAPCLMGQRVFAATDDLDGIYVGPRGRVIPAPIPHHEVVAMRAAGPTLAVLLKKAHGTPIRRVVGLDPVTLGFRFDAGEHGSEPDDDWERQMVSDGWSLVFVSAPNDDRNACELRSVDTTTGRTLWSKPIGSWQAHRFVGGQLVVFCADRVEILAPSNGQLIASLV